MLIILHPVSPNHVTHTTQNTYFSLDSSSSLHLFLFYALLQLDQTC